MPLNGINRRILREALEAGYQSYPALLRMVREGLDFNLNNITDPSVGLSTSINSLITKQDEDGKLAQLIAVARQEKPENVALRRAEQSLGLTFDPFSDVIYGDALSNTERDAGIESIVVSASGFEDIDAFHKRLGNLENSVCSISFGASDEGTVFGTGFLVGKDLILTNWHVIEKAHLPLTLDGRQIKVEFDYRNNKIKTTQSSLVSANWLVAFEPRILSDRSLGLDYALLRLREDIGAAPLGTSSDSANRGWLPLISQGCTAKEPILILQHPFDAIQKLPSPMKLTIGIIQEANAKEIKHTASTLKGSSGAPVVNAKCELLGIHSSGDEATANTAKRISAVKAKLQEQGHNYWD